VRRPRRPRSGRPCQRVRAGSSAPAGDEDPAHRTEELTLLSKLTVDDSGLTVRADSEDHSRALDLLLDGRRLWSFRLEQGVPADGGDPGAVHVPWPRPLLPYLDGTAAFTLRPADGGADRPATTAAVGSGHGRVTVADRYGIGLVVNKWGALGHALGDYDPGMVDRLLDHLDEVRRVLAERLGVEAYVTGGTLLGPYRDGRVLPHDDDADLAYLSRHTGPADVVRENFAIGRALVAAGLTVVRCSAGHLQIHFEHEGRPDGYVDVFTGWIDDTGWWHQLFPVRVQGRRDQLLPLRSIDVEGRPEPMCQDPEFMLEAIYGPGWAIPDPAFGFRVPPATSDRFWGWIGDQNMDREAWEAHYRYDVVGDRRELGSAPSSFAREVAGLLRPGTPVVEIGCGRGHDALWLAGRGHAVDAVDYVRWPIARARDAAAERSLPARFATLNLFDPRRVPAFGAELAARREPVTVLARGLLGTLHDAGRPQLFRLLSMLLRPGGSAHLDVPRRSLAAEPAVGVPLHRSLPLDVLAEEMGRHGLRIRETHEAGEVLDGMPWGTGDEPVPTTRMVVSWQRATR